MSVPSETVELRYNECGAVSSAEANRASEFRSIGVCAALDFDHLSNEGP